jgi:phage shock protein A
MSGLFRRLLGKGDEPGRHAARPDEPAYDPRPAEAAYRRLLELAAELRTATAGITAAQGRLEMREAQLHRSVETYERIAQEAVANGRAIQAESAMASSETAAATLAALAPQGVELAQEQAELERAVARLEAEAAELRARLDAAGTAQAVSGARARLHESQGALAGHRGTLADVVRDAEDEALRLEGRARGLAELHGQEYGTRQESP